MAGSSFLTGLGPHVAYILASYAVGLILIGGLVAVLLLRHRAAERKLRAAEMTSEERL
jgi:heme exporter protein CcmD